MDIFHPTHLEADTAERRAISLRASVSSLPNEILSTVFEIGHASSRRDGSQPPFESLVTQVARRWRDVALGTPQLWTYIHIPWGAAGRTKAKIYLSRSGALPLDIILEIDERNNSDRPIPLVADIIGLHVARWRSLQIESTHRDEGDWPCNLFALLTLLPSTTPRLAHLQISTKIYGYEIVEPQDLIKENIFSGGASSLTSIRIRGFGLHLFLPPLESVTRLELHSPIRETSGSSAKMASMLASLPALTLFVINGDFVDGWTPEINVTMPSLLDLRIHNYTLDQTPGLLKMISAPLLQSLLLENIAQSDLDGFMPSLDLTSRPPKYPQLDSLTILAEHGGSFRQSTWMNVFRAFSTITHFTLNCNISEEFIMALEEHGDFPVSWPHLHTLTLDCRQPDTSPEPLRRTVSTRFALGHAIQRLYLSSTLVYMLSDHLQWLGTQLDWEEIPQGYCVGIRWSDDQINF